MEEKAIIVFNICKQDISVDLKIPLDITAKDLIIALSKAFDLEIDADNIFKCYLKSENPVALLRGNKTLQEFGIRNGSIINFTD